MAAEMGKIQTTLERARIAAEANIYLRSPKGLKLSKSAYDHENEEIVVIPAGPEEPAVITFHRMQLAQCKKGILATKFDDSHGISILFNYTSSKNKSSSKQVEEYDLPGGMTTLEWIQMIRENSQDKKYYFTANGTEFELDLVAQENFQMA